MRLPALLLFAATTLAHGQWTIEDAHTTASLRGIHNVGGGVAWASGSQGTVLRTTDDGAHWRPCATPPGAEKLDFRGIQAFDADTAIVMSSGKGDLSRLYKTTDACQTWKLVFTNPDKEGFWDALLLDNDDETVFILGDPVDGDFRLFSQSGSETFQSNWNGHPISASPGESAFAASNSLIVVNVGEGKFSFVTGGSKSEIIHEEHGISPDKGLFSEWSRSPLPFDPGSSSGAFSMASSSYDKKSKRKYVVVVGGDYQHPDSPSHTVAVSSDWGYTWQTAQTPPHGYRSAVAYDPAHNLWITVGPNGTDISTDDGRNWQALKSAKGDPEGADRDWNALSLPFVVGPRGRIGKLNPAALPKP